MTTRKEQEQIWCEVLRSLTRDQRRVAQDIAGRSEANAQQELFWIRELSELTETLCGSSTEVHWSIVSLFWIRLWDIFTTLMPRSRWMLDLARQAPKREVVLRYGAEIYAAARSALEALSMRQALTVDYHRHRSAHLRQDAYTLRLSGRARSAGKARTPQRVLETRRIEFLDRTFTIEDLDRILGDRRRNYGREREMAAQIARRVRRSVARLRAAIEVLHSLPSYR